MKKSNDTKLVVAREDSQQSAYSELEYREKFEKAKIEVKKPDIVPFLNLGRLTKRGVTERTFHVTGGNNMQNQIQMQDSGQPKSKMASNHSCHVFSLNSKEAAELNNIKKSNKKHILGSEIYEPNSASEINSNKRPSMSTTEWLLASLLLLSGVVDFLSWNNALPPFTDLLMSWASAMTDLTISATVATSVMSLILLESINMPGRIGFRYVLSCNLREPLAVLLIIALTDVLFKISALWIAFMTLSKTKFGKWIKNSKLISILLHFSDPGKLTAIPWYFSLSFPVTLCICIGLRSKKRLLSSTWLIISLIAQAAEFCLVSIQSDINCSSLAGETGYANAGASLNLVRVIRYIRIFILLVMLVSAIVKHRNKIKIAPVT